MFQLKTKKRFVKIPVVRHFNKCIRCGQPAIYICVGNDSFYFGEFCQTCKILQEEENYKNIGFVICDLRDDLH